MSEEGLFERLLAASELSPVFARQALARALRRAKVEPAQLTGAELQRALPEIRRTLQTYLEARADPAMRRIELLVRG